MLIEIILHVYRWLDERLEGLGPDSALAFELHNRRRAALHDVLDALEGVKVTDWGLTNDRQAHELADVALTSSIPEGKTIEEVGGELVSQLMSGLIPKQDSREIEDFIIELDDTTVICHEPGKRVDIEIWSSGRLGGSQSFFNSLSTVAGSYSRRVVRRQEAMAGPPDEASSLETIMPEMEEAAAEPAAEPAPNPEEEILMAPPPHPPGPEEIRIEPLVARARPVKPAEDEKPTIDRYVNLWFTRQKNDETSIEKDAALVKSRAVYLRAQIARYDSCTLLAEAVPFPLQEKIYQELAPELEGKPIPLEVALFSSDFKISESERTQKLMLASGQATGTLYFQVVPLRLGSSRLRVCVFYRNHLLQSLKVTARVAARDKLASGSQIAHVEMTFSADFALAASLPQRGLWIGINKNAAGSHTLCIKGDDLAGDKALNEDLTKQLKTALKGAREALQEVSFEKLPGGRFDYSRYRFDRDNRPCDKNKTLAGEDLKKRFKQDMAVLAGAGSALYNAVFEAVPTAEERNAVKAKTEAIKQRLAAEQVIQVARLARLGDIWPWALIYDLAIDPDNVDEVCHFFSGQNGRVLPYAECRAQAGCLYPDLEGGLVDSVICPYGFWGFKHIIEQPTQPGGKKAFEDLPKQITTGGRPLYEMLVANNLVQFAPGHLSELENKYHFSRLGGIKRLILDALKNPPDPHILYFFCHGEYASNNSPYLVVGDNVHLLATSLNKLGFNWKDTHPLVFINGCHTVDLSPETMASLMEPFVKAMSSGIIGTEITVYSYLATEFAREFFRYLLAEDAGARRVGPAIKYLRLQLLAKYNPLGLVYTPYCSSELSIAK